jgi:hypothetical protein
MTGIGILVELKHEFAARLLSLLQVSEPAHANGEVGWKVEEEIMKDLPRLCA